MRLHIVEGYSGVLTEMVRADELDFAVVPAFEGQIGLRSRLLVRDREMLLSGPRRGLTPLAPVRLKDCRPFKVVLPGPDNIRRRNLETYFQTHGVEVEAMLEMDAMIGTLEFVARSDWVTVLPSLISVNDIGGGDLVVNPIADPLALRRVRGDPAVAAHAEHAGAAVPRTLRGRGRAHPPGLGPGDRAETRARRAGPARAQGRRAALGA